MATGIVVSSRAFFLSFNDWCTSGKIFKVHMASMLKFGSAHSHEDPMNNDVILGVHTFMKTTLS